MGTWNNPVVIQQRPNPWESVLPSLVTNLVLTKIGQNFRARENQLAREMTEKQLAQTERMHGEKLESAENIAQKQLEATVGNQEAAQKRFKETLEAQNKRHEESIKSRETLQQKVIDAINKRHTESLDESKAVHDLTENFKYATAEEKILQNPKQEGVKAYFDIVNKPDKTSMWVWEKGYWGGEAKKINIPEILGKQYTVQDVLETAQEEFGAINDDSINSVLKAMEGLGQYPRKEGNKTFFPVMGFGPTR